MSEKITGELINHGFDESLVEIEKEAYILGKNSPVPITPFRPDGEWPGITYEPQAERYETSGCTIWGMENQVEMFVKEVYKFEPNYDERFTYLYCDVNPAVGANPQNAYESVRHNGLIDNEPMPNTLQEFLDKNYHTQERINKGKSWLTRWTLWHDWLVDTSKPTIKGTLPFSPVALSVTAWFRDADGLYIDNGRQNTHWCVAFGYVKPGDNLSRFQVNEGMVQTLVAKGKIILKIFDTYDYSWKLLHPDHRIGFAKRIYIEPKGEGEVEVLEKSGILAALRALLKRLAEYIAASPPKPTNPELPPPFLKQNILNLMCLAIQKHEGWILNPPSRSVRNNNPGNLVFVGQPGATKEANGRFAVFKTYQDGLNALKNMILNGAKGKSKVYFPSDNLYDFFNKYAPKSDNNDPVRYAEVVAKAMGVNPARWRLKDLL